MRSPGAVGTRYLTLVYDIGGEDERLLAVAEERTEASLRSCLEGSGEAACKRVQFVCSDMWKPYLNVIAERLAAGDPRAGPVPRDAEVRQGAGRDPCGGGEAAAARRLRAGLEAVALVLPEAAGEPDGQADGEAVGVVEVQPADGAGLPAAGGVPAALGVQERGVGGEVPGRMDGAGDAVAAGADEEDRADDPGSSAVDPELVPGPGCGLVGGRGGAQQQGETGDEKVVRFPDLEVAKLALLHNLGRLPEPKRTHRFC